jgi:hypothetical protein
MLSLRSPGEDGYNRHGCVEPDGSAAVLLDGVPRVFHLAFPALAAQLGDELEDLAESGGRDRVPLRLKAA